MNATTQEKAIVKGRRSVRIPEPGERERVLAEWAASGKKVAEIAKETGWSPWTLYRWRADARGGKAGKKVGRPMLAVPRPEVAMGQWAAEVAMGNGLRVRLAAGCAPRWAAETIAELRRC